MPRKNAAKTRQARRTKRTVRAVATAASYNSSGPRRPRRADDTMPMAASLPLSFGAFTPSARHQIVPVRRGPLDCDPTGGIGVRGCFRHAVVAKYGLSGEGIIDGYKSTPLYMSQCSDFIYNLCDVFTWYRFRAIRMTYVPSIGATYTGNVSVALTDGDEDGIYPSSAYSLSSFSHAVNGPIWKGLTTEYKYDGAAVWLCHQSSNTDVSERNQCHMLAIGEACSTPNGTTLGAGVGFGFFWFDYHIEFFGPRSSNGTPSYHALRLMRSLGASSTPVLRDAVDDALENFAREAKKNAPAIQPDPDALESGAVLVEAPVDGKNCVSLRKR